MGLLKGEYKMELYGMNKIEDLESFLIVVFNDFCLKNNLSLHTSADDLLHEINISEKHYENQKEWLSQFVKLWEENI